MSFGGGNTFDEVERRKLLEENELLRREIEDLKHLNKELMLDSEDNDARIIKNYKAKIVQLERQVQLLTKCNNIKSESITDIDNFVSEIVGDDNDSSPMDRAQLRKWGKMLQEKIRNYNIMTKQAEHQKYYIESKYFGSDHQDTIQNVCNYSKNDDIPYLDVTNVLELENDLVHVYRNLYRMRTHLTNTKDTTKDPNFVLLSNITISNISKILNEMVELSLVLPKKDKASNEEISSSYKQFYNPMSLSTAEVMSKLPRIGNSKTSKDIEDSVKNLVRAFHAQKSLFEIDLQLKQEELNIATKTSNFYTSYMSELLKEIDQKYKEYTNQIQPLLQESSSRSNINILEDIVNAFEEFDKDSTEENLRTFLLAFKDNIYSILSDEANKGPVTKKPKSSNVNIKAYYEKFRRHMEEIQSEFEIRKNEFIEKMYNLNPEVEKYEHVEPFISYTPYDNRSSVAKKPSVKKMPTVSQSVSNVKISSNRLSAVRKESNKVQRSSETSVDENVSSSSEASQITPKITASSKQETSKLNPNTRELAQRVEDQKQRIQTLTESLSARGISDMQHYAITKQIKTEKAELLKLERTLKSLKE
ncbi:hypothetical protein C9374_005721 [Naegleria lovaniensis]|uniref:Uncharacterized protein n=1 Tax=Naegleria lovaniensis TaxID=51637 RepID=A0AA88GJ52_NAELO|nr:uncharacterized protein C9374_005721 [Naegleria lovaniensis]KAG2381929.1 hypothetical protein C9374_005721 [Naegleria lovaniensis]